MEIFDILHRDQEMISDQSIPLVQILEMKCNLKMKYYYKNRNHNQLLYIQNWKVNKKIQVNSGFWPALL